MLLNRVAGSLWLFMLVLRLLRFSQRQNAMKVIGFTAEEQHEIFRLVAAVLYIGNVHFADDGKGGSTIADRQVVEMVAYLMRTEPVAVEQALLYRTITTGEQGRGRSSVYSCPQDPSGVSPFTLQCALQFHAHILISGALFKGRACQGSLFTHVRLHHPEGQ